MSNARRFVLQSRDRHLLRELAVLRVIDREQAKMIGGFGSVTRVNARLLLLVAAGLLQRMFLGTTAGGAKALYSLSPVGARVAGVPHRALRRKRDQALVADFFVQHRLAINDFYCALKYGTPPGNVTFQRWLAFQEAIYPGIPLIPDGYVEFQTPGELVASFLEVDLGHERLKVWKQKVAHYLQLAFSGAFTKQFGHPRFRTLVIAHSPGRMHSLRKVIAELTEKVFWFADFDAIKGAGIFGPVWFRPRGEDPQTLLRENP